MITVEHPGVNMVPANKMKPGQYGLDKEGHLWFCGFGIVVCLYNSSYWCMVGGVPGPIFPVRILQPESTITIKVGGV